MNIRKKYQKEVSENEYGYTIIPNCLIKDILSFPSGKKMESKHRLTLMALLSCDFYGMPFRVGIREIKKITGIGNTNIVLAIQDLVNNDLIEINKKSYRVNEYNLRKFYEYFINPTREQQLVHNIKTNTFSKYELPADVKIAITKSDEDKI